MVHQRLLTLHPGICHLAYLQQQQQHISQRATQVLGGCKSSQSDINALASSQAPECLSSRVWHVMTVAPRVRRDTNKQPGVQQMGQL